MNVVARVHVWLLNALKALSCVVVLTIFVLIVSDVAATLFRFSPWDGTIGVVEYGMLWFAMLAAPWLARIKGHVFIDALTQLLPPTLKTLVAKFAYMVAVVGSAGFCYFSVILWWETFETDQIDERGIELMQWWLYAPMPISFFLIAIEFLRFFLGYDDMYGSRTDVREGM